MGIERIGGRGGPTGVPVHGTGAAPQTGAAFEASKPEVAHALAPAGPPATALERLRSGQLDVHGYVELKVDEATRHLPAMPPAQLAAIRDALRERISTDPSLLELVRTATGQHPPPRDE
jgi:hypothetical protein